MREQLKGTWIHIVSQCSGSPVQGDSATSSDTLGYQAQMKYTGTYMQQIIHMHKI